MSKLLSASKGWYLAYRALKWSTRPETMLIQNYNILSNDSKRKCWAYSSVSVFNEKFENGINLRALTTELSIPHGIRGHYDVVLGRGFVSPKLPCPNAQGTGGKDNYTREQHGHEDCYFVRNLMKSPSTKCLQAECQSISDISVFLDSLAPLKGSSLGAQVIEQQAIYFQGILYIQYIVLKFDSPRGVLELMLVIS